jgi:hypothetical protein
MFRNNKAIIIIAIVIPFVFLAILVWGILQHQLVNDLSLLNIITSILILFYWLYRQSKITIHLFELREMIALSVESIFLGTSIYQVATGEAGGWLKIATYIIFGIHMAVSFLFLLYTLTFKIKKLI